MANALYDKGRESFLGQNPALDWDSDNIKVSLVDITSAYTVNLATDDFYDDVTAHAVAVSSNLGSKTVTAGVADAADVTLSSVSGAVSGALVIWKDTGAAATSPLIAYIDTATGLPVTPNGGNITITWDNGANKIFKL